MLYELHDISEVKLIKASRDGDPNPVRIRLVMVLVSIELQPRPVMVLTDFSQAYQKDNRIRVAIDPLVLAKVLSQLKCIGVRRESSPNTLEYLPQKTVVLLRVTCEVFNGRSDLRYVLKDITIINKNPRMVLDWELKHQRKVKSLFNKLQAQGFGESTTNKAEFEAIANIVSSKREEPEPKKQKVEPPPPPKDAEPAASVNPLFIVPENSHSQISNTQIYDLPDSITEESRSSGEKSVEEKKGKLEDVKEEGENLSEVMSLLTNTIDATEPIAQSTQPKSPPPSLQTPASSPETTPKGKINHEVSDEILDTENSTSNSRVVRDPDAIGKNIPNLVLELGEPLNFLGYALAIEPHHFNIFGRAYKELLKATNFRMYISNVRDLKLYKVDKNCLCLEFRSKEHILEFFGYETLEEAVLNIETIRSKLAKLTKGDRAYNFQISRKKVNLSNGVMTIWKLEDTIDGLLNSSI